MALGRTLNLINKNYNTRPEEGTMEYYIRYERMGGDWYYMIYRRVLCFHSFYERWNTTDTARARLQELT